MTRLSVNTPFMLGFDHLERMMDELVKTGNEGGFPPYNIEQIDDSHLRITLAVAGYDEQDLDIELHDNQLVVRGSQNAAAEDHTYLYRGIAARVFQRGFMLAHGMKIKGASLEKGLLHIDLEKPKPETKTVKIKITSSQKKGDTKCLLKT